MKQATRLALATTMLATAPAVSMAETGGKITFEGKVTDQTCQVTINGASGDVSVTLPTVPQSQFLDVGAVAGRTPFVVKIAGCKQGVATAVNVNVTLTNPTLTSDGALANTAPGNGAAEGVALQLLSDMTEAKPFNLTSQSHLTGLELEPGATEASHEFAVQYISHAKSVKAGTVQAVVNYDITYL